MLNVCDDSSIKVYLVNGRFCRRTALESNSQYLLPEKAVISIQFLFTLQCLKIEYSLHIVAQPRPGCLIFILHYRSIDKFPTHFLENLLTSTALLLFSLSAPSRCQFCFFFFFL